MRLVDLHCDWLLQYAGETTLDDSPTAIDASRLARLDGYLHGVAATVLICRRSNAGWDASADRWRSLDTLITRYEAEFAGRLLIGPDDIPRYDESLRLGGLCYGVLGIGELGGLVLEPGDLDSLARVFDRGARLFQLVSGPEGALAGSSAPGDDRGLTPLGRDCLTRLAEQAQDAAGPRTIVDLSGMGPNATSQTLDWFQDQPSRVDRLAVVWSRGGLADPGIANRANLERLRAIGGLVGLSPGRPHHESPESLKAAIETLAALPFLGQAGYQGIAVGSDLFGLEQTLPGLENAPRIASWLAKNFDREVAHELGRGAGTRAILGDAGA